MLSKGGRGMSAVVKKGSFAIALSVVMLTLAPVTFSAGATSSVSTTPRGGMSVVYKNGPTPAWIAELLTGRKSAEQTERISAGLWI